jgi:hypothetical protein
VCKELGHFEKCLRSLLRSSIVAHSQGSTRRAERVCTQVRSFSRMR